jgi:drug/metabolite transporter (DMT)-like permease
VPCLLPFLRGAVLADLRTTARPGLVCGAVLSLGYLLQSVGMNETSASMGGFLAGLIVLIVAVGGFVFFHARFGPMSIVGLLLGVAGLLLLCWRGEDPGSGPHDTMRGILLQVASSTSYAFHILLLSRYGRSLSAVPFCLWQLVVVSIAATIATAIDGKWAAERVVEVAWTPQLIVAIAYLGLLATALGIGVQTSVQHKIPPTHVALLFAMQPLFAALIGWLVLGDRLGGMQLLGGAVIVAGVIVTSLERSASALRTRTPE